MKVTKETPSYIVLDEFLPESDFDLMLEYVQTCDFARNPKWIKPWDLSDEMPWQTGEVVYTRGKAMAPDDPRQAYPTGLAIDLLFDRILGARFYRTEFKDHYVTARTYLHPQGSALDWHDDGGRFAGAYSFYVHPRWHASWGGELLIIQDPIGRSKLPDKQRRVDGQVETIRETWNVIHKDDLSEMLMDNAVETTFVFPKPNRMVFMKGGLWHKVNLVKSNAPMARCAVAGFFLSDDDKVKFWR